MAFINILFIDVTSLLFRS